MQSTGFLSETATAPNADTWCLRQFTVEAGTGHDQDVMYVLWNNRTCLATSNMIVNSYMLGPGTGGSRHACRSP